MEYEEYIRRTNILQNDMAVIQTENGMLEEELAAIPLDQGDSANVNIKYATLQAEVETMEMLNVLQFADEQELLQLIQAAESKL
ncbi:unnamed protein product [Sphagnum balticum]